MFFNILSTIVLSKGVLSLIDLNVDLTENDNYFHFTFYDQQNYKSILKKVKSLGCLWNQTLNGHKILMTKKLSAAY